jgi:hypothetical protein
MAARNIGKLDKDATCKIRYFLRPGPEGEEEAYVPVKTYRDIPKFPHEGSRAREECQTHFARGVLQRLGGAFNLFYGYVPQDEKSIIRTRLQCAGRRLLLQAGICQVEVAQYNEHGRRIDSFKPRYVVDELPPPMSF